MIGGDQGEKCGPFLNRAAERRRCNRECRRHKAILEWYWGIVSLEIWEKLKAVRAFWAHLEMEIVRYLTPKIVSFSRIFQTTHTSQSFSKSRILQVHFGNQECVGNRVMEPHSRKWGKDTPPNPPFICNGTLPLWRMGYHTAPYACWNLELWNPTLKRGADMFPL